MNASSTLGGLAGAIALTIVNETAKRIDPKAPRLDLLGENAVARLVKGSGPVPQIAQKYFPVAADLISNSLFYGMARGNSTSNTLLRGTLLGLAAGVGAVVLPKQMGLPSEHTGKTTETKLLTVAWYVIGGLVAAFAINAMDNGRKSSVTSDIREEAETIGKDITNQVEAVV